MRGKDPKRLPPDRMDHHSLLVPLIWTGIVLGVTGIALTILS